MAFASSLFADEKYLFVWAGDQARSSADFVAVVNFDERSPNYGSVIKSVPLTGAGTTGNEPHHVGISADGKVLAAGGLLSVLKGQPEIFFFDISDPRSTRFLSSVGQDLNLMVTSDFICPTSTLHATPGGLDLRGSVRVWDFKRREILRTVDIPGAGGTIDVKLIPGDADGRAYTAGMLDDKLYLVDTRAGTATPVFDFKTIVAGGWPQLMRMTGNGKRLFITMNQAGKVAMFDTSHPASPKLLSVLDLGANAGPHYLRLSKDERRLVVSDYFLNEDAMGKVHAEGDHKIHVVRVTRDRLVLDPRFQLDCNTAFAAGPARPHGLAVK